MKNTHHQYFLLWIKTFNCWKLNCDIKIIWDRGGHICNPCSQSWHHCLFLFYIYKVCHLFDYPVIDIVLVFNLMKTSFQEDGSWYEADNRPAHILFGSLHRKWKYVSKGKKTKLSIYHLCTYESFPRKGRTRNGLSKVGRKLRNHTSPHIPKMCKYVFFKFHTVSPFF